MRITEELIEAVEYSGDEWFLEYNISEAKVLLEKAIKEKQDETEVAILLALLDIELEFGSMTPEQMLKKSLRKMKRELNELQSS